MADVAQRIGPGLVGMLDQPSVRIGLMIVAVSAAIAWILSAFWCFRDTRARTRDMLAPYLTSGMVLLFSPALFPFGLAVYLLVRPQETWHERDLRVLARIALDSAVAQSSCRACGERIDRRWVRCPACATALSAMCRQCDRGLDPDWSICPWCAAARVDEVTPAATVVADAASAVTGVAGAASAATAVAGAVRAATVVSAEVGAATPVAGAAVGAMTVAGTRPALAPAAASVAGALDEASVAGTLDTAAALGTRLADTTLGFVPSMTSRGLDTMADAARVAVGAPADRHEQPIPVGPGRSLADRRPPRAPNDVPSTRSATSKKRLRAVREGVQTARSLGVRRPVTGARAVQSTSTPRTASALEAEGLGGVHGSPQVPQP